MLLWENMFQADQYCANVAKRLNKPEFDDKESIIKKNTTNNRPLHLDKRIVL